MLINVKFRTIFALFMLFLKAPGVSNGQKWVKRLIKYTRNDVQVFQTVLIIGEGPGSYDKRISHIVRRIQQELPSQVISLAHSTTDDTQLMAPSLLNQNLARTTLFITIPFLEKDLQELQATDTTDFLNQLSTPKTRPKCLMITLSKRGKLSYHKLLHNMWSNYFLDFTILEIEENQDKAGSLLWNRYRLVTTLYNFNPFTEIYNNQKYTRKIKLFPNKLLDLNGFEMKVGSFDLPPYLYVERNSSGYPIKVSGPDALFAKALSKQMNFRISEIPSQDVWFGRWHCNDESQRTAFAYLLGNNSIRFITNQGGTVPNCEGGSVDSQITGSVFYCALIPILPAKKTKDAASPTTKWIYLAILVFLIRIITILMNFDNDIWPWLEILRASLGFSTPREPSKLSERIVFVSVFIAFSIFSCNIFAMLTETKLTKKLEMPIDTLAELIRTNLVPVTTENNLDVMREQTDPVMQELARKSSIVLDNQDCIDMLVQGKNVACIIRESTALIAIRKHRDANNDPVMKILKERVFLPPKVIYFEPNSPYVRQVDVIILRLIQSGLIYHWEKQSSAPSRKSNRWDIEEEIESVEVLVPLIFFITFGCTLSILVFICELLVKYFDNRIHGVVFFLSQGSLF